MSNFGKISLLDGRLSASVTDPDLQSAIQKARAEFADSSASQVNALWQEFETLLNTWRAQGDVYAPVLRSDFRMRGKRLIWVGAGQGDVRPNYIETFLQLVDRRHALLPRFIRSLHRNVRLGLIKALALLILREAANGNPKGALRASNLFDKELAESRVAMGEGFAERNLRLADLKPAIKGRKQQLVTDRSSGACRQPQTPVKSDEQPGSIEN